MLQVLDQSIEFDVKKLSRERVANQCVCCGSQHLKSSPAILMPFVAHRVFGWKPIVIDDSWGLKTIPNGMAYSICNSLFCVDCEFLFLDIRFSESELNNLYHDYRGEEYSLLREQYEPGYKLRNNVLNLGVEYIKDVEIFLEPHLSFPLSILDWGGDTGKNTPFRQRVKSFDIYDINNKALIKGARKVDKLSAFKQKYNLIICSNVLEHIPFPSDLLFDIQNTMNDESILYIEVPFEDIVRKEIRDLHLKKKYWHEHINFFSENSLIKLIQNCGYTIIAINRLEAFVENNVVHLFQVACKR